MNVLRVMDAEEIKSADLKHLCQAVSANDEPCDNPATVRAAAGGFAIRTLRTRSGIHVHCRPARKEAKRSTFIHESASSGVMQQPQMSDDSQRFTAHHRFNCLYQSGDRTFGNVTPRARLGSAAR